MLICKADVFLKKALTLKVILLHFILSFVRCYYCIVYVVCALIIASSLKAKILKFII